MGLSPKQYYALTHKEYNLMCEGFFRKQKRTDLQQMKRDRQLGWIIYCGYADPKKAPKSMQEWWKIEGEIVRKEEIAYNRTTKKQREKIDNLIAIELAKLNKK